MAWVHTKDGRLVNTDWFDKDRQIDENKKQADEKNGKLSETEIQILDALEKITHEITDCEGNKQRTGKVNDLRFRIGTIMKMPMTKSGFKRSFVNKADSAKSFKIVEMMETKGYIKVSGNRSVFILGDEYKKYKEKK